MPSVTQSLADIEREVILHRYKFYGNNKTRTANSLGICIRTLRNKLIEYGVQAPGCDGEEDLQPKPGFQVEPDTKDSTQRAMPMRKRKEV